MVTVVPSGFIICEPDKHRLPGTCRQLYGKQPGHAIQVHQLPHNCESVCAENRERNLHKNQMFFATAKELLQRIMLVFCRVSSSF